MGNRHLQPYRGPLSAKEIAEGMNLASENARRLRDDARLLFESNRFPSSLALAILSIEETRKISILRKLALFSTPEGVKAYWKEYTSHTEKNRLWPFSDLVGSGARHLEDFRELVEPNADHPLLLDSLKQVAIYTDCLGKKHWSCPADVVEPDLAVRLLQIADLKCNNQVYTEREIELWIEHLKPVWERSLAEMKTALLSWRRAMIDEGLAEDDDGRFAEFVLGETDNPGSDLNPKAHRI